MIEGVKNKTTTTEKQDKGETVGMSEKKRSKEGEGMKGGLAGRQRGRVRVWREDREIDRITGFKSRTKERDGKGQREKA